METSKCMLLMDGAYMGQVGKNHFDSKLDPGKLRTYLEKRFGKITRAFWFTPYDDEGNRAFHHWMQKAARIEVVTFPRKPYRCRHCGNEHDAENGLDVGLVIRAIELAKSYDKLILCNGDSDLRDGLRYIRDVLVKQVVLVGTADTIALQSTLNADEVVDISEPDIAKLILKD